MTAIWILVLSSGVLASPFDPHPLRPASSHTAYVDGWFARVVDSQHNVSFTTIIGMFQPAGSTTYKQAYAASVVLSPDNAESWRVDTFNTFPDPTKVTVKPRSSPEKGRTSNFSISSDHFSLNVDDDKAMLVFEHDQVQFRVLMHHRKPWDPSRPNSAGPDGGWDRILPLPLNYYVHSLGSEAEYELQMAPSASDPGFSMYGNGFAHLESNYGTQFPQSWLWVQGVRTDGAYQILATDTLIRLGSHSRNAIHGPLPNLDLTHISKIPVRARVLALRSPTRSWDMRGLPFGLAIWRTAFNATEGWAEVTAHQKQLGLNRLLRLRASAPVSSFSQPLFAPYETGFRRACAESYAATVQVDAFEDEKLVESFTISLAALEFGGGFYHE